MPKRFFILLMLLAAIFPILSCGSGGARFSGSEAPPELPVNDNPGLWLALLFRNYISPVDGDRCPSIPTCSAYSAEVFRRYGFFKGWIMTVDRLIHEANEGDYSPLVYRDGRIKIVDPPESNDIW